MGVTRSLSCSLTGVLVSIDSFRADCRTGALSAAAPRLPPPPAGRRPTLGSCCLTGLAALARSGLLLNVAAEITGMARSRAALVCADARGQRGARHEALARRTS